MIQKAWCTEKVFHFRKAAITSRNTLLHKTSYFICLEDTNGNIGIGECSPIYGLSLENEKDLKRKISEIIHELNHHSSPEDLNLKDFPSLRFALEVAELDLKNGGHQILYENDFSRGKRHIPINGLIWMGKLDSMNEQLEDKIAAGFRCIKVKIGAHEFEEELNFLKALRKKHGDDLEIRLDANGAFEPNEALEKLNKLSEFKIHSIEQPIKQGQWKEMKTISNKSPIPIALDEELIGCYGHDKDVLLDSIQPAYIILKPSLLGGLRESEDWIKKAERRNIGWWATSFLESDIGLNAIAQWVSTIKTNMYQGLGTGKIYADNLESPLELKGQHLYHNPAKNWKLDEVLKL